MMSESENGYAGRGQILTQTACRYFECEIDDIGLTRWQSLSAGEMSPYFEMVNDDKRTIEKHAWMICHSQVDGDGHRVYRDKDIVALQQIDFGLLIQLANVAYLHCNNFGDLEKKVATLVADLPIDSREIVAS